MLRFLFLFLLFFMLSKDIFQSVDGFLFFLSFALAAFVVFLDCLVYRSLDVDALCCFDTTSDDYCERANAACLSSSTMSLRVFSSRCLCFFPFLFPLSVVLAQTYRQAEKKRREKRKKRTSATSNGSTTTRKYNVDVGDEDEKVDSEPVGMRLD